MQNDIVESMCWMVDSRCAAGMSEDSDYTSDINFPVQHQHNSSAHQYRSHPDHPYCMRGDHSADVRGRDSTNCSFTEQTFDQSFDRSIDRT